MEKGPVLNSLQELPDRPHVLTIGSFDGVHRGHQYLLENVRTTADRLGVDSVAITFDPLPGEVLRPDKAPPRLCTTSERTRQMLKCGIDRIVILPFSTELASQSADEFLQLMVETAHPAAIVVGDDFAFGYKRQGTPEFLAERADHYGYELLVISRTNPGSGVEWSSSFARSALAENGDVKAVQEVLGRAFRLTGTVRNGDHRGRDLGYPTANLQLPESLIVPADGIYAALATIGNPDQSRSHPALVYVGTRPTFGQSRREVEAYLLDFDGDLYDQEISVDFLDRIRGDRAFDSADELVAQMNRDEASGRRILADHGVLAHIPENH
jgi:riboflavin kinase / FMN adenylyltransferase